MSFSQVEYDNLKKLALELADQNVLQDFLMTVWKERPDSIRILFEELIKDPPEIADEKEKYRRKKLNSLIEKNFEEFDEVFRNLAKY